MATLLTSWTKKVTRELNIHINGQSIPTEKTPKFLGVTLDSLMTFAKYSADVVRRLNNGTKILKALSDSLLWCKR